jgi:hypothetical protein
MAVQRAPRKAVRAAAAVKSFWTFPRFTRTCLRMILFGSISRQKNCNDVTERPLLGFRLSIRATLMVIAEALLTN